MKARHHLLLAILSIVGLAAFVCPLSIAAGYPDRPIQLVVANVPGSQADISARLLAEDIEKSTGAKFVVMNKPGASGALGTTAVVRSKKDGYTILYTSSNPIVYTRVMNPESVPYDPDKDLEFLGVHLFFPNCIVVQANSPWKTFGELVDYAKKNPGKLRAGTVGSGAIDSFNLEIIHSMTGAKFTNIPFEGGEAVSTALLGGHVEVAADVLSKYVPYAKAGKVRILLITKKRADYPEIPTITELGYKQALPSVWLGLFGPAGLPEDVKKVLVPAIAKAANNPELKAKIDRMGNIVDYMPPAEQKRVVVGEYERALSIAKKVGLRKP